MKLNNKSVLLLLLIVFVSMALVLGGCSQKKNDEATLEDEQSQKQLPQKHQVVKEKNMTPEKEENNYGILKPVMDLGQEILNELKKPKKVVLADESVQEIVDGVKKVQQPTIQSAQQPPVAIYQYQQPVAGSGGSIENERKRYADEEEPGYSGALRERAQQGWSSGEILPGPLNEYRDYALKLIIRQFRIDFYSNIKNSLLKDGLVIIPCKTRNPFLGDRRKQIRLDFEIESKTENGIYKPFYVISTQNIAEYIDESNKIDSEYLRPDWLEFEADLQKIETAYCNMNIGQTIENYDRKLNLFVFLAGNGILYYRIYPIAFAYNKNPEYIN